MRLTIRNSDGTVSQPMNLDWAAALEKLAAYEDTGLEPEAVKGVLESLIGSISAEIAEEQGCVEVNRAKEIACAEAEGRLVILPCAVEDAVYYIDPYAIGKTVFFSREEAEAAMKGETKDV